MEKWSYSEGLDGQTQATVSEIVGKEIKGRIYRNGIEYRPTDGTPTGKQFSYNIGSGQLQFAIPFDGNENLDIPYEQE